MVEILHVRRWEKRNRTNFFWGIVKVFVGSVRHGDIETFCLLRYWYILSPKFINILNYIKSLCIIFALNWFKYFDQKNQTIFVQKCFNILRPKYIRGGKMFQYLYVVYYSHWALLLKFLLYFASDMCKNRNFSEDHSFSVYVLNEWPPRIAIKSY